MLSTPLLEDENPIVEQMQGQWTAQLAKPVQRMQECRHRSSEYDECCARACAHIIYRGGKRLAERGTRRLPKQN